MEGAANDWIHLILRWLHVIAGVMWIGHLWFFNFVNSQLAKTYTPESKKAVLPELMPRALYWFRWGAFYTWVTGFLLLGVLYYMGNLMVEDISKNGMAIGVSIVAILVIFFIYDVLWKTPLAKNEMVGGTVSFVLLMVVMFGLGKVFSPRATYIHLGALLGTIMMMNVWMRIWPAQRKIIGGVKGANPAPDASVPAMAGLRSKHNTYMSVPLIFAMVSNHFPTVFGMDYPMNIVVLGIFVLLGWGLTKFFYMKSASAVPSAI